MNANIQKLGIIGTAFFSAVMVAAPVVSIQGCGFARQQGWIPETKEETANKARKELKAFIGELFTLAFDVRPNNNIRLPHWQDEPGDQHFPNTIEIDPRNIRPEQMEEIGWVAWHVSVYYQRLLEDKEDNATRIKELTPEAVERGAN